MAIKEEAYSPVQVDQNPILFAPQIDMHLTGGKVQDILDDTLQFCYQPLFHLNWFKRKLALVFCDFEVNTKAKFSKKSRQEFAVDIFNLIQIEDEENFVFKMREMGMHRTYIQEIVDCFLTETKDIDSIECKLFQNIRDNKIDFEISDEISNLEQHFDGIPFNKLSQIRKKVQYWFDVYIQFKDMVAAKYYRLCYKFAKRECATRGTLELDSLFKSLLIALNLAIDKYNSEKGALASYIQTWITGYIKNESYALELGQAFKLASWNIRALKKNNITTYAISTDSEEYKEMQSNEVDDSSLAIEEEIGRNIDVTLLNTLWKVNDPNVDFVLKILGLPKVKS